LLPTDLVQFRDDKSEQSLHAQQVLLAVRADPVRDAHPGSAPVLPYQALANVDQAGEPASRRSIWVRTRMASAPTYATAPMGGDNRVTVTNGEFLRARWTWRGTAPETTRGFEILRRTALIRRSGAGLSDLHRQRQLGSAKCRPFMVTPRSRSFGRRAPDRSGPPRRIGRWSR
jgi:hypothetical protein